jgi:6-phosphogluconate dehydrogenase
MIGLGVMGQNLALNVADHGFRVAVWNLESDWTTKFVETNADKHFIGGKSLEEFVGTLERPRVIMMMIKAGSPVDATLDKLVPLLAPGDIVIDGGNSWFKETQEREAKWRPSGVRFFGCGVSGGEEGARHGPSLMPGGDAEAWQHVKPIFEAIAAKTESGPCVAHCGPDGAGHFVKMVHNGIEYGDMQLIAEAYDLLRRALGMSAGEIADIFTTWNQGALDSFLIDLTARLLRVQDPETGKPLVDVVLDKAGQKGTGKWTAQVALDLAVPIPTIAAAIDARVLSSMKTERVAASAKIAGPSVAFTGDKKQLVDDVRDALLAAKYCSYAQGMHLLRTASDEHKWSIPLREMARIWKGGCIIRAKLLDKIMKAYDGPVAPQNLLMDPAIGAEVAGAQAGFRRAVGAAITLGIPTPALSASLAYFDSYRTASLPQNLTQAQRDAFGAHTYQRSDHPERGFMHSAWK